MLCHPVEGDVDVARFQVTGDVGESRAEQEGVDAVAVAGDGVEEMQEQARIAAHRAGNVAQHDQRWMAALLLLELQRNGAGAAQAGAEGRAEIDALAAGMGAVAAGRHFHDRQAEILDELLRRHDLGRGAVLARPASTGARPAE